MVDVKTRRQEKAAETRARMLGAAYDCFAESGFHATTMAAIAGRADVAVQTLYFTFHTKDELLRAVHDRLVLGSDALPPREQPWHQRMLEADGLRAAVRHMVVGNQEIVGRIAPLIGVFHSVTEEPAGEVWRTGERRRHEGYRRLVGELTAKAPLRRGLSRARATDLLFVLQGPETYRALVLDLGWPPAKWRAWLESSICHELFGC
jgi:AcrR family transcriptional regulator